MEPVSASPRSGDARLLPPDAGHLNGSGIPFLVGGAYALARYAGIERHTKDLDIFAREADRDRILEVLAAAGYRTEVTFPHWLAKARRGDDFIDVIYRSGNGVPGRRRLVRPRRRREVLGVPVRLCPAEEIIWSKAFVMERERFDGADVAHLLLARVARSTGTASSAGSGRTGGSCSPTWPSSASPSLRARRRPRAGPAGIRRPARLRGRSPAAGDPSAAGRSSRGQQYLVDLAGGYQDARIEPRGRMTAEEVEVWTAGIEDDGSR